METIIDKSILWLLLMCIVADVICYPTGKIQQVQVDAQRNEKYFPNGTVVGKYSYMDKEGNPVQVKYYADEASYGVELKSLKLLETTSDPTAVTYSKDYPAYVPGVPEDGINDVDQNKDLKKDAFDLLNKEMKKISQYKEEKSSPDFEIYYQNELNGPKQCGKEKVRVYFDKERKTRNVLNNIEADKFCEQF